MRVAHALLEVPEQCERMPGRPLRRPREQIRSDGRLRSARVGSRLHPVVPRQGHPAFGRFASPTRGFPKHLHKGQDNRTNIPKRDRRLRSELTQHPQTVTPTNLPDPPLHKHSRAKERGGDEARRGGVHRGGGDDGRREGRRRRRRGRRRGRRRRWGRGRGAPPPTAHVLGQAALFTSRFSAASREGRSSFKGH